MREPYFPALGQSDQISSPSISHTVAAELMIASKRLNVAVSIPVPVHRLGVSRCQVGIPSIQTQILADAGKDIDE